MLRPFTQPSLCHHCILIVRYFCLFQLLISIPTTLTLPHLNHNYDYLLCHCHLSSSSSSLTTLLVFLAGETDGRNMEELESLVWTPCHGLTDRQIDQFLVMSRSVGTFARALDCSSSVKQPSLHMSAAAASRDVTLVGTFFESCEILFFLDGEERGEERSEVR